MVQANSDALLRLAHTASWLRWFDLIREERVLMGYQGLLRGVISGKMKHGPFREKYLPRILCSWAVIRRCKNHKSNYLKTLLFIYQVVAAHEKHTYMDQTISTKFKDWFTVPINIVERDLFCKYFTLKEPHWWPDTLVLEYLQPQSRPKLNSESILAHCFIFNHGDWVMHICVSRLDHHEFI